MSADPAAPGVALYVTRGPGGALNEMAIAAPAKIVLNMTRSWKNRNASEPHYVVLGGVMASTGYLILTALTIAPPASPVNTKNG